MTAPRSGDSGGKPGDADSTAPAQHGTGKCRRSSAQRLQLRMGRDGHCSTTVAPRLPRDVLGRRTSPACVSSPCARSSGMAQPALAADHRLPPSSAAVKGHACATSGHTHATLGTHACNLGTHARNPRDTPVQPQDTRTQPSGHMHATSGHTRATSGHTHTTLGTHARNLRTHARNLGTHACSLRDTRAQPRDTRAQPRVSVRPRRCCCRWRSRGCCRARPGGCR